MTNLATPTAPSTSSPATVGEATYDLCDGMTIIVPMGTEHNIVNTSATEPLKFYTIYSPPHHENGTIHRTKAEADADEEEFHGGTSE